MKKLPLLFFLLLCHFSKAQTWTVINSPTINNIHSCSFINQDTGWVVTDDSIFKTIDGGNSWINQNFPPDPPLDVRFCNTVQFIDANNGIIACGNYLSAGNNPALVSVTLWTTDGGTTWTYKDLGNPDDYALDAKLASPSVAYSIGQYGQAKTSTDGGATWTAIDYSLPYSGVQLFPFNNDTVYFAGDNNLQGGSAFGTTMNAGALWNIILPSPSNSYMQTLFFTDSNHGWIAGAAGMILYTSNGGGSWTQEYSNLTTTIFDIEFINALEGWALSVNGDIIHTIDGGLNWSIEHTGTIPLFSLSFTHPNRIGYAVGNNGLILKYLPNLGINDPNEMTTVTSYPNPVVDELKITNENSEISDVVIFDITGKELMRKSFTGSISLDLQNFSSGIYFYEVSNGKGNVVRNKFVKI